MNLHEQFVQLGKQYRNLAHQLGALLPEIYSSGIWEKYAGDIYEYARKYAGMASSTVKIALRLPGKLTEVPRVLEIVKEVGVRKVDAVASLITPENEEKMVERLRTMSKPALIEMGKEMRGTRSVMKIELDEEMQIMFFRLKKKLGLESNREVLRQLLVTPGSNFERKILSAENEGRSVSKPVVRELKSGPCFYCNEPAEIVHHLIRWAEGRAHRELVGVCKICHELCHNGILEKVDHKYQLYRQEALK
ncbi:hypothetical protein JKY72_00155 [Candidatus Gracilibacteria bacterium]|nr:hypothetical protein [Candidatus Gracilibacteria bacterium]